jgi:hypothetical protein
MAKTFTYALIGAGVDFDGWYKWNLRRSDGKTVKVNKARYRQLIREGRIVSNHTMEDNGQPTWGF